MVDIGESSAYTAVSVGSRTRQRFAEWIGPIALLLFFLVYQSWPIFTEPQFYSDDQRSNWLLALRQHDPTFLSHDYAFGNPLFQGHYIPVYLAGLYRLIEWFGGIDGAMIFLHTVMLAGYLLSMFILIRYLTGHSLVAAFVAIISALSRNALAQEIWAATDMRAVMPRTAFLVAVPLLTMLLFRWLPRRTWWPLPLLGLLIGLVTNLHPPSGLFFLQISLTLGLLFGAAPLGQRLFQLILAGLGFGLGGLPTVWAVLRGVGQARQLVPAGTFQEFAEILHWRMRTEFPFPPEQVNLAGVVLTERLQTIVAIVYLVGMGLWAAVTIWLACRHRVRLAVKDKKLNGLIIGLLALNLPLVYLVTTFLALDLIVIATAYWVSKLIRQDYDRVDLWALVILICAGAYSFVASAGLGWLWETFELWSLTSFFGEQARLSRLVYLPLFIFLARWLHQLIRPTRDRAAALTVGIGLIGGLVVRHWHFLDPWGPAEWGMGFSLVGLAVVGVWLCSGRTVSPFGAVLAQAVSSGAAAYLWLYIAGANLPWLAGLAMAAALLAGFTRALWSQGQRRWLPAAALLGLLIFGFGWGGQLPGDDDSRAPLRTQAMKALGLYEYGVPGDWPPSKALYDWARQNTDKQALFYFNDHQYEFRAFAGGAVTHSWKDVGGGYYTPALAIDYFRRFQKLDAAYSDPARLLACAEAYQADYIILEDAQTIPGFDFPTAFNNERYVVYARNVLPDGDESLCQ